MQAVNPSPVSSPNAKPRNHGPPHPLLQYYPYVNNATIDAKGLLDQKLQDFGLEKFGWLYKVSRSAGLDIRLSETNSL